MVIAPVALPEKQRLGVLKSALVADTKREPAWDGLPIDRVAIDDRKHDVASERAVLNPFSILLKLSVATDQPRPRALVVMPMSGGHVLIVRDLIYGLLQTHDVAVLDWINARYVPLSAGRFGFRENVASTIDALRHLGPGIHLVGICQSGPIAALAASALHQAKAVQRPVSLALLCSPIDPEAEQTRVASMLAGTSESWLAGSMLGPVPSSYVGHGRMVYGAELQQARLLQYLSLIHISEPTRR